MFKHTTNTWSFKNVLHCIIIFNCFPQKRDILKCCQVFVYQVATTELLTMIIYSNSIVASQSSHVTEVFKFLAHRRNEYV